MIGNDSSFGDIMNQAVQMKSASQAKLRNIFNSWPVYFQNSMFVRDPEVLNLRLNSISVSDKIKNADIIKEKGNELFKKEIYQDANIEYEKALAIFIYCINNNPKWKNQGIKDEDISIIKVTGKNQKEQEQIDTFKISCYLNIATCNDALEIDPKNAKAYYRKAIAQITPASAGGIEMEAAIKDLELAFQYNPTDVYIRKLLLNLKKEKKKQKLLDKKTFTGLFDRGTIHEENMEEEIISEDRKRLTIKKQKENFDNQISEFERLAMICEKKGQIKEAEEIRCRIDKAKEEYMSKVNMKPVDFRNPTPKMIEEGKERGIDLTDPAVQEMLCELQQEHQNKERNHDITDGKIPIKASKIKTDPVESILLSMTKRKLCQLLKVEGIKYNESETVEILREKGKKVILERVHRCENDKNTKKNIYIVTFLFVGIWLLYRFYILGIFSSLYTYLVRIFYSSKEERFYFDTHEEF